MSWSRAGALALYSLTIAEAAAPPLGEVPLPVVDAWIQGPVGQWSRKSERIGASRVRLNGLGVRTHANWVLFRLPFDATQHDRIRSVTFHPSADRPTAVGSFRIGSVCLSIPDSGPVDNWTLYTASGIGWTQPFAWHQAPPSEDPSIVGINVPTRVANYVACGGDDHLRDANVWSLDVTWEER